MLGANSDSFKSGLNVGVFRRPDFGRWPYCNNQPCIRKQRAIFVMVGFTGGNKVQVNPHCLCQIDQKRQKMTVMVVSRSQKENKGETLPRFDIKDGQGVEAIEGSTDIRP